MKRFAIKLFCTLGVALCCFQAGAQTLNEAKKLYEEEKYENQRRYRRIKQDKIDKERRDAQQNKIMQVLTDAKEAVKKYDPEFETEESIEIINAHTF